MSPPIREGSGNDIGSIRLGDGSEIAEVRTGAGDLLFSAIPDSVVDDFEEQQYEDKNNTLSDYYAGDLSKYARQTSVVQNGSYALEITSPDGGAYGIASITGLNAYPTPGDTFRIWMRTGASDEQVRVYYAAQSATSFPNRYQVDLDKTNNRLGLLVDGSTLLASESEAWSDNEWYEIEVNWDDSTSPNTHTITAFDDAGTQVAQISAQDGSYTSGGVGYQMNQGSGATARFDYYRIL